MGRLGQDLPRSLGSQGAGAGIPDSFFGRPSSLISLACQLKQLPGGFPSIHRPSGGNRGNADEGGSRRSNFTTVPGILQQAVCGAQGRRGGMAPDYRSGTVKFVHTEGEIQDGNSPLGSPVDLQRGLVRLNRFEGCLFPGANASSLVQVPTLRLGGEGIPIPDTMFRTLHRPTSLHSDMCGGGVISPLSGRSSAEVPGRLASYGSLLPDVRSTQGRTAQALFGSRTAAQHREVAIGTVPINSVFRNGDRFGPIQDVPIHGESEEVPQEGKEVYRAHSPHTKGMGMHARVDGIPHVSGGGGDS